MATTTIFPTLEGQYNSRTYNRGSITTEDTTESGSQTQDEAQRRTKRENSSCSASAILFVGVGYTNTFRVFREYY